MLRRISLLLLLPVLFIGESTVAQNETAPTPFKPTVQRAIVPSDIPRTPEGEYEFILKDVQTLPVDQQLTTRYLTFHAVKPQYRFAAMATLRYVLRALSWSYSQAAPVPVAGTEGRIWRINMFDYARDEEDLKHWTTAWEKLTAADPYFLVPWVDVKQAEALKACTGSTGAILRADFFIKFAMLEDDVNTKEVTEGFYSQFLGLPNNEAALFELLDVRLNAIAKRQSDRKAAVLKSGEGSDAIKVAYNNRYVFRVPTILHPHGAHLYFSQDYLASTGKRNVLLDPLNEDKDGGEYIWRMPNGLHGFYLTKRVEKEGKVVFQQTHEAPSDVAHDDNFRGTVKINSCTYCHPHGINTYKDEIAELLKASLPGGKVLLTETKPFKISRTNQLYNVDQMSYVLADRANYDAAILAITGMEPVAFAAAYKQTIDNYDRPVDLSQAAWEFGVAEDKASLYLADHVVSTASGGLLALIKGREIPRDMFEEEFKNGKLQEEIRKSLVRKGGTPIQIEVPAVVEGVAVEVPIINDKQYWVGFKGKTLGQRDAALITKMVTDGEIDRGAWVQEVGAEKPEWKAVSEIFPELFPPKVESDKQKQESKKQEP
jgi:hypothetical protein